MMSVRVRIAPSPTGNLHVGTARTALFNYLFARRHGGSFILRIEDTDLERSQACYVENIYQGLHALGLQWSEGPDVGGDYGPYVQSDRLQLYQDYAELLVEKGLAYYSYVTEERLDQLRQEAAEAKKPFVYREDPSSPESLAQAQVDPGRKPSIRFRIPRDRATLTVQDAIRGEVTFDLSTQGDFVIIKSNGTAAYNFAVVVDDALMKISHVIRGEDHLPNTPKQMLLYEAFEWPMPVFAHLSMILAPDRSKLSKRHGATAVSDFVETQGVLPEAFVNFLALLGWSSPEGEEILSADALIQQFSLERIAHSGAVFDLEKLRWVNAQYIRNLPLPELFERAKPYLPFAHTRYSPTQWETILGLVREPIHVLSELPEAVSYFEAGPIVTQAGDAEETLKASEAGSILQKALEQFSSSDGASALVTVESAQAWLKAFANDLKPLKTKTVFWTLRAALTGRVQGADLPNTLVLLGETLIQDRLKAALATVTSS
jgi:nondiscriminating glutamyl-tRNA synthetase